MTKTVYIVYHSKTGNTKKIAEQILESFSKLKSEEVEIKLMSATELDLDALKAADGYILGTPNYLGAPSGYIKVFFDELYVHKAILKGRPVFCFVSHGGSGYLKELNSMCRWLELATVGYPIAISGKSMTSKELSIIENNIKEMLELI
jgi:multimeric flavodoxin WrbA